MSNSIFSNSTRTRQSIFTFAKQCASFQETPNCDARLDPSNRVIAFGGFEKGQLPAQPDIAGRGVIAIFAILTIFVFVISLALVLLNIGDLFYPGHIQSLQNHVKRITSRGQALAPTNHSSYGGNGFRRNDSVRAAILSIIDLQMVLTVAYGYSFASDGICSALMYHYYVFMDVVLMSCSSSILAVIVLPNYWKTPISAAVRLAATAAVFFFALQLIFREQLALNYLPKKRPNDDSQDSLLLLPAMCFLDKSFNATINKGAVGIGNTDVGLQLSDTDPLRFEFYFFIILTGCFALGFLGQIIFWCLRKREDKGSRQGRFRLIKNFWCFLWVISWLFSFIVTCYCLSYVVDIRDWVKDSGWLKHTLDTNINPESEIIGLGQLLPIWALALILVALLDHSWVLGSSMTAAVTRPRPAIPLKTQGASPGMRKAKTRPGMGHKGPPRLPRSLQNREPRLPF